MTYGRDEFNAYVQDEFVNNNPDIHPGMWAAIAAPVGIGIYGYRNTRFRNTAINALRHVENVSPGGILRTFRLSEIFSAFTPPDKYSLLPQEYDDLLRSRQFKDYLAKITGIPISQLERDGAFRYGLEWSKTGENLGELRIANGKVISRQAGLLSTGYGPGTGRIAEFFGRVMGVQDAKGFLSPKVRGALQRAPDFVPIAHPGGVNRLSAQMANAVFSSNIGRLNQLLEQPFQYQSVQTAIKRLPFLKNLNLAIKEGSGLQMLGRYAAKAGGMYLGYHALQYLDYVSREYGPPVSAAMGGAAGAIAGLVLGKTTKSAAIGAALLGGTRLLPTFRSGIIPGIADIYAELQTDVAHLTYPLGKGRRRAEELYPGITSPLTVLGFAGVGLLQGAVGDYGRYLRLTAKVAQVRGLRAAAGIQSRGPFAGRSAYEAADAIIKAKRQKIAEVTEKIVSTQTGWQGLKTQAIGKWRAAPRYIKGAVAGGIAYGAISSIGELAAGDYLGAATTLAGTAGAAILGIKGRPGLALAALAAPFLLRGLSSPNELERIYSGKEEVAIKHGRFWSFGRSPFEGNRPRFRPHRIALARRGITPEASLYGSESEYWRTDPIMNPLSFLMDPYGRERAMYEAGFRFPVSQTPFEDFPILGPVLSATVGRLLKPPVTINPQDWLPPPAGEEIPGLVPGLPAQPIFKTGIRGTIGEQAYNLTQLIGLPGFALDTLKESLTGRQGYFTNPQYSTPASVGGMRAGFAGLELGDPFGFTELIRRFIPRGRSEVELVNPLPSGLPSWLPSGVPFEQATPRPGRMGDSTYFLDFSRAQIYNQIKEPWLRLPGTSGFESRHPEARGLNPEQYSPYLRFETLADLAPWSEQYTYYSKMMTAAAQSGQLTPEQIVRTHEIRRQVSQVKKSEEFNPYRFDAEQIQQKRVTIEREIEPGVYKTREYGNAPIVLEGTNITGAALSRVALKEDADITKAEAARRAVRKRTLISDYLNQYAYPGASLDIYVHRDPNFELKETAAGPIVPAVFAPGGENLGLSLIRQGLGEQIDKNNSINTIATATPLQRGFGNIWETITHGMETPLEVFTPLAPTAKFIHQRTALEDWQRNKIYGREIAMWENPISHFLAPGLRTTAWWMGWRGLPQNVKEQFMINEYFDQLEYVKYKQLEKAAKAKGEGVLAAEYQTRAARTMTGANPYSPLEAILAVPKQEREHFQSFVDTRSPEERQRIMQVVSPQMGRLLQAQWQRKEAQAANLRLQAGIGGTQEAQSLYQYRRAYSGAMNEDAVADIPIPGKSWVGWQEGVDIREVKLKTIMDKDMDYHDYGFWQSDVRELERRPFVPTVGMGFTGPLYESNSPAAGLRRHRRIARREGNRGYDSYSMNSDGRTQVTITSPGYDRVDRYLRDPSRDTF